MAAPVPHAAVFDLESSQRIELPSDNGLLRPSLTQSLEFNKVRCERALAGPRALMHAVADISAARGAQPVRRRRQIARHPERGERRMLPGHAHGHHGRHW